MVRKKLHLRALLRLADHRSAGVVFHAGSFQVGLRQEIPFPAYRWNWVVGASFRFSAIQRINQLELYAILQTFRTRVRTPSTMHQRFMHILDSRVAQGVLSKGRSSSIRLNAIMRRIAAFSVAADIYIFPLWTISQWNAADSPSCAYEPRGEE